jgi:hypothetical protein
MSTHLTRADLDTLLPQLHQTSVIVKHLIFNKTNNDGYMISRFVSDWAGKLKLTAHELPNLFNLISCTGPSTSKVYLTEYKDASWVIPQGAELQAKIDGIKSLIMEALAKDKLHLAQLKQDAITHAQAAAQAFAVWRPQVVDEDDLAPTLKEIAEYEHLKVLERVPNKTDAPAVKIILAHAQENVSEQGLEHYGNELIWELARARVFWATAWLKEIGE